MNNVMEELKQLVTKQLEEIVKKGSMSPTELKTATEAVCLIKEIDQVEYMENYEDEGYSRHGWSMDDGANSYMRGRSSVTGRYVSRDNGPYMRGSYDMGRSGHSIKDRIKDKLERMMDDATTEYERQTIMDCINGLRD